MRTLWEFDSEGDDFVDPLTTDGGGGGDLGNQPINDPDDN